MYFTTLADVIDAIGPQIDGILVNPTSLSRIRSIAQRLPSTFSDSMGFERFLGSNDADVDYAFGLSDHGANWLMSLGPWPKIRGSLSDTYQYTDPTARPWLEFDTRRGDAAVDEPSLYIGLDPWANANGSTARIVQTLNRDKGIGVDRILGCIDAIPSSSTRLYLGAMYSRCTSGVRISIAGIGAAELVAYLEDVRWPGNRNAVEAALETLVMPGRRFGVQIDVSANVDDSLGIELMLNEPYPGPEPNAADLKLLDDLRASEHCTRQEQNALLRWPARIEFTAPFFDRYIDARSPEPGKRLRHGTLITAIHHYKLAFSRDGSIQTKAYFGVYIQIG